MLIGGLDVGTTGCKLTVYDDKGTFLHNEYKEYEALHKGGEHEIDAAEIFGAVCYVLQKVCEKYPDLTAVGVTTFGETFVALDEEDRILLPAMLYTDPRGSEETSMLCKALGEEKITHIAGAKPHQMYSLPKIMWIKNQKPEVYKKIKRILLMEDFIIYMLTGNAYIDYSLAARTLGLDIRTRTWSKEIFEAAGIDISLMSQPVNAGYTAGTVKKEISQKLGIPDSLKLINGCHDQVAAAIGAGVFAPGQAVDGTGTVECITPVFDKIPDNADLYNEGYSVVPYIFDNTYVCYAFSFTGGATLKWYKDNFAPDKSYSELDKNVPASPTGLMVMPHFAGAATPYMDNGSKAAVIGLTLEHTSEDIYKALMEGVTYEIMLNIEHLENCGISPKALSATGGGAYSEVWLQIKADILNRPVISMAAKEAGTCGTCMLVGVAAGIYKNLEEAKKCFVKENKTFLPNPANTGIYKKYYESYRRIYDAVRPLV